jgi:hypothetical protein
MLQWVFGWFGHQPRSLWVFDRFSFRRHSRTINAEGTRARIPRGDGIERGDILEPFSLLWVLIESSRLLCEPFHLFYGELLAWACSR